MIEMEMGVRDSFMKHGNWDRDGTGWDGMGWHGMGWLRI